MYHTSREIRVVFIAFCKILSLFNVKLSYVYLSNKYGILSIFCLKFSLTKSGTLPTISKLLKESDNSELSQLLVSTGTDFQFRAKPRVTTQKHSCECDWFNKLAFFNCCHATHSFKNTRT